MEEKGLSNTKIELSELIDQLKHMVFLLNLQGKIIHANSMSAFFTGYSHEELMQKNIQDLFCDDFQEHNLQQLWSSRALFEKQLCIDNRMLRKDHFSIPVEVSFHPIDSFKEPIIMTIAKDITERKAVEDIHRMIENYKTEILEMTTENNVYALLVDRIKKMIGEGIVFTGISDESISSYELSAFSPLPPQAKKISAILGRKPKDIKIYKNEIPTRMLSIYQSGKLVQLKKGLHDIAAHQIPQSTCSMLESMLNVNFVYSIGFYLDNHLYGWLTILRFELLDGIASYIEDMVSHATHVIGAIRSRKALNESERSHASLISHLPGFVYRCLNDEQWTMIYLSEACAEVTGYASKAFINNKELAYTDIIDEEFREKVWEKWQECLAKKKVYQGEYPIINKKGVIRWVREQGSGVYADDGTLQFVEGFISDITEQKHIIESKEQFINLVSHELKTPMTAMHGGINMILKSHADQCCEEAIHILKIVNNNIKRLATFASDVLDFQKISSDHFNLHFQFENMESIVDEAIETMRLLCTNPEVQLIKHIDQNLPLAFVDRDKMLHVLTNLISNGIKNTEKGFIKVEILQNVTQDQLHIKVVDTGTGIKKEDLGKLFTKYYQIKNHKNNYKYGTGLGLVIAKEIMHKHGGDLRAESYWGEGTTMHMILPLKIIPAFKTV